MAHVAKHFERLTDDRISSAEDSLKDMLELDTLDEVEQMPIDERLERRYLRFRRLGEFREGDLN